MSKKITELVKTMSSHHIGLSSRDHQVDEEKEEEEDFSFTRHESLRISALVRALQNGVTCWPFEGIVPAENSLFDGLVTLRYIKDEEYNLGPTKSGRDCRACGTTLKAEVHKVADDIERSLKNLRVCLYCVRLGQRASCELCRM